MARSRLHWIEWVCAHLPTFVPPPVPPRLTPASSTTQTTTSPENTDLTYGAVNFGYESARLCYSNRGVDGTPLATVNLSMGGSDFCNVQCSNASGCNGFTFQPTNQEGAGVCTIYGTLGDADPTITTGVNIYAVGGTVCPDIV